MPWISILKWWNVGWFGGTPLWLTTSPYRTRLFPILPGMMIPIYMFSTTIICHNYIYIYIYTFVYNYTHVFLAHLWMFSWGGLISPILAVMPLWHPHCIETTCLTIICPKALQDVDHHPINLLNLRITLGPWSSTTTSPRLHCKLRLVRVTISKWPHFRSSRNGERVETPLMLFMHKTSLQPIVNGQPQKSSLPNTNPPPHPPTKNTYGGFLR